MNEIEKVDRTCATCGCSIIKKIHEAAPASQMFCRKSPAKFAQMRMEVPRLDINKKVVMSKDGKTPVMENKVAEVYLYDPTMAELVCFEGWRPIGTEPGDQWHLNAIEAKYFTSAIMPVTVSDLAGLPGFFVDPDDKKN